jgi:osmotically inducible lipoprotein OsmB
MHLQHLQQLSYRAQKAINAAVRRTNGRFRTHAVGTWTVLTIIRREQLHSQRQPPRLQPETKKAMRIRGLSTTPQPLSGCGDKAFSAIFINYLFLLNNLSGTRSAQRRTGKSLGQGAGMQRYSRILLVGAMLALTACSSSPTNKQVGATAGAVIGGVVGSAMTGGSTVGTVAAAGAGVAVGYEIGKRIK